MGGWGGTELEQEQSVLRDLRRDQVRGDDSPLPVSDECGQVGGVPGDLGVLTAESSCQCQFVSLDLQVRQVANL